MTWLVVKTTFKKTWVWIKNYWQVPAVLFYTLIMWLVFRKNNTAALEVLDITKESYGKQIDELNKAHKAEVGQREKNLRIYNEVLRLVEKDYKASSRELTSTKKNRIKQLITSYQDSPKELSKIMSVMFGINYVETVDDDNNDN
tara:strand:- start:265 stop:696 length:432 start_codon:yes stop_codon:yes gene_type:complete